MNLPVNLQSDESLIQLVRRYPVSVILEAIGIIIATIVILWILNFLNGLGFLGFLDGLWNWLMIITVIVAVVVLFFRFYAYRNDLWIVTNQRLVDSTKRNPFNHQISSTDLVNVQDITVSKSGVLQTMFDYGDVRCQTASAAQVFVLRGVPKPNALLEVIDNARDNARKAGQASSV